MRSADTVRIAHLSDVHLPPIRGFSPAHWNVKRTLGWLNWHKNRRTVHTRAALDALVDDLRAQQPDHILVSGDLVNIGLPREYEAAHAWLETLGSPSHVSVVPGNHDIYVPLATDPGVGRWAAYMASDAFGRGFGAREGALEPGSLGAGHGPRSTCNSATFPYVRRVGPLAIIGVNSAIVTAVGYATGRVGVAQLARLAALLDDLGRTGLLRVVMIHHPPVPGLAPDRRALADAAGLEAVLRDKGADLVVFGHNHRNIRSSVGATQLVGVASASAARTHHGEPAGCYNLIEAGPAGIKVETRGFIDGGSTIGPVV
jgi:3',5'-cyclic AMP phosphodiesterase CpdA